MKEYRIIKIKNAMRVSAYSIFYGLTAGSLFFFTSCVQDVKNIRLPSQQPKIVISCFISPQTNNAEDYVDEYIDQSYINARISWSQPLYVFSDINQTNNINNALVTISDGKDSLILAYGPSPGADVGENDSSYSALAILFPIIPGRTYTLTVSTPQGYKASASTTVPSIHNTTATALMDTFPSANGNMGYKIDAEWADTPGSTDYYRVNYEIWDILLQTGTLVAKHTYPVVSDNGNDGGKLIVEGDNESLTLTPGHTNQLQLSLLNIDVNYYKYYMSLHNYSDDNPFAEPSLIYTNVQNGLGIFASYQEYITTVNF
jgi:hypothetical protein